MMIMMTVMMEPMIGMHPPAILYSSNHPLLGNPLHPHHRRRRARRSKPKKTRQALLAAKEVAHLSHNQTAALLLRMLLSALRIGRRVCATVMSVVLGLRR